jgi:hypothetical protein
MRDCDNSEVVKKQENTKHSVRHEEKKVQHTDDSDDDYSI